MWPEWWDWQLELVSHLERRMEDRDFNEVEVREMLEIAHGYRPDVIEDRFVIETRNRGVAWEVIVEPDPADQLLLVITAYPVEKPR